MGHPITSITGQPAGRLARIEHQLGVARRELAELWRTATPADRIFAIERLLRDETLAVDDQRALQQAQDRVRDAWVTARVAKHLSSVAVDAKLAALQLTLAERERDATLYERGMYDELFAAAEGFLRTVPVPPSEPTFKDLVRQRRDVIARLVPILPPLDG